MLKRRESLLFIITTAGITILTLLQLNNLDFRYGLGQIFLQFIFFCTIIYALYRLAKDKRPLPLLEKAKPVLLGLSLTAFLFFVRYMVDTDGGKKRLMVGGVNHDLNSIHVQLYTNQTFKFLNVGPFGGRIYRGKYSLTNDTLFLDNDSLRHLYPSLRLVKKAGNKKAYFEPIDSVQFKAVFFIYKDYSTQ